MGSWKITADGIADSAISISRTGKRGIQVAWDLAAVFVSVSTTWLVNGLSITEGTGGVAFAATLCALMVFTPFVAFYSGAYKAALRFVHLNFTVRLFTTAALSALAGVILASLITGVLQFGLFSDLFASLMVLMAVPRALVRLMLVGRFKNPEFKAVIYGAGAAGRQLAMALEESDGEYKPVGFVDDAPAFKGISVYGYPVVRREDLASFIEKKDVKVVLMAMPSIGIARRKKILLGLQHLNVRVQSIPGIADLVSGKADINELRDISLEDLLGRDAVQPNNDLVAQNIQGQSVMITGAGGSIGSELARQAFAQSPSVLVLYDISEIALYEIDAELERLTPDGGLRCRVIPVLGSVRDQAHLYAVMREHQVATVYHAAAYKHVPIVEYNPLEGLRNNILGTWHAAQAAIDAKVSNFVLISTDKAVRPTNVMGASKRFAELGIQALASNSAHTAFSMVRFGNVLGSSGSVVPKFQAQVAKGGPITVTHPDITRYFMTIPEAAQLVIQAGALSKGGEVFVLDMGAPVKIENLAKRIVGLAGLTVRNEDNPNGDIEIEYTGLRPGEKLYEELLIAPNDKRTSHDRIRVCNEPSLTLEEFEAALEKFDTYSSRGNLRLLRRLLIELPLAWQPQSDLLFDHSVGEDDQYLREIAG